MNKNQDSAHIKRMLDYAKDSHIVLNGAIHELSMPDSGNQETLFVNNCLPLKSMT